METRGNSQVNWCHMTSDLTHVLKDDSTFKTPFNSSASCTTNDSISTIMSVDFSTTTLGSMSEVLVGHDVLCGCPIWKYRKYVLTQHHVLCPKLRDLNSLENQSGVDCSVKEYGASKYTYRAQQRLEHVKQAVLNKVKKIKNKSDRAMRKGRNLVNQAASEDMYYDIFQRSDSDNEMLVVKIFAYIANLLASETHMQYGTATLQFVVGVVSPSLYVAFKQQLEQLYYGTKFFLMDDEHIEDQSGVDGAFKRARNILRDMQFTAISINSVPLVRQLSNICVLAALAGIIPNKLPDKDTIVTRAYDIWVTKAACNIGMVDIWDMVLQTVSFAMDFVHGISTNSLGEFVRPSDVVREAMELLSLQTTWENGHLLSMSSTEYYERLQDVIQKLELQSKKQRATWDLATRNLIIKLRELHLEVGRKAEECNVRIPAPTIVIYGASQIGKSMIMNYIAKTAGFALGFEVTPATIWYPQKGDEYDSGYNGRTNVIIDDDVAAEKIEFMSQKGAADILRLTNTIPYMSVQAEITKKGKIPFNQKLNIMSTNSEMLNFIHTMATPEAGFRRAEFFHVVVKPEYAKADGAIDTTKLGDGMGDYYWFQHYEVINEKSMRSGTSSSGFKRKNISERMTTSDFTDYLINLLRKKHVKGVNYKDINEMILHSEGCEICCKPKLATFSPWGCKCVETMEDQALREILTDFLLSPHKLDIASNVMRYVFDLADMWSDNIITRFITANTMPVFDCCVDMGAAIVGRLFLTALRRFGLHIPLVLILCFMMLINVLLIFTSGNVLLCTKCVYVLFVGGGYFSMVHAKRHLSRMLLRECIGTTNNSVRAVLFASGSVALALAGITQTIKGIKYLTRLRLEDQGNLNPTCRKEVEARMAESNMWLDVKPVGISKQETISANMTREQFIKRVSNNIVRVRFCDNTVTNALMIMNNVMLIPKHACGTLVLEKTCTIYKNESVCGEYVNGVYFSLIEEIHPDILLVTISKAWSVKDLRPLFIKEMYTGATTSGMLTREANGDITLRTLYYKHITGAYNASVHGTSGSIHTCSTPTRKGDCGSPVFSDSCPFSIIGIHSGGSPASSFQNFSCSFGVSLDMIERGLRKMSDSYGDTYKGQLPILRESPLIDQYGKDNLSVSTELHDRDMMLYVSPDKGGNSVFPIGCDASMRVKRFSEVQISPISSYLTDVGIINKWGKTPFQSDRDYSACFQEINAPMDNVLESELAVSVHDYIDPILERLKELESRAAPLSMFEICNGRKGDKFIRSMNMSTSSGLGLRGNKRCHFDKSIGDDHQDYYMPKSYVYDEFRRVENILENGKLPGQIFVGALKDEPTDLTKNKVRVFQVGTLTSIMLIRKYTLPIINELYTIPLLTEMAQGINAVNEEWDQLARFILSGDANKCLEGDFSKYDLRQTGQSIRACGFMFYKLALCLGYTIREAEITRLLFDEMSFKTFALNGSIFDVDGVNPSGVPVTIVLNSITNSLVHRLCYYRIAKEMNIVPAPFRVNVRFMTQGDDSIGSSLVPWFNMRSIQKAMLDLNMPYTDGKKNSVTQKFFHFDDISFCKRTFRYETRVHKYVAPIALPSIWKSLHCYMKSDTPEMDIVVQNCAGALRELARHDAAVFNHYVCKLRVVFENAEIVHMVPHINFSYDDWWEVFASDYKSDDISSLNGSGSDECSES